MYVLPLPVAPVMNIFRYSEIYSHVASLVIRNAGSAVAEELLCFRLFCLYALGATYCFYY